MILAEVKTIRHHQPKVGGRKLHRHLALALGPSGVHIGRDRLFNLLREHRLLIRRRKNFKRTTYSRHGLTTYPNLVKTVTPSTPGEAYAADITYIKTHEGYCYLSLITDMYSRKIVGYAVSRNLTFEGALKALRHALRHRDPSKPLIHHSDRGLQYCSHDYTGLLKKNGVRISMTEESHVYENALAERVNGILKSELIINKVLPSVTIARRVIAQSIEIYNKERLHFSLNLRTPEQVHGA